MPRYLVEQTFPERLDIPSNPEATRWAEVIIGNDALEAVTWLHSYVTPDKKKSFCICDAPTPEAVRRAARRNGWPVDRINEVRVLDAYFYV